MLKTLFKPKEVREQERQAALWRRADALMKLGRPATEKELEEFSIICDALGVRADKMPVVSDIPKAVTA